MIYFDNASTTNLHPEVIQEMSRTMKDHYANPSSTHSAGRRSKVIVENARNFIAKTFNCNAKDIIFTSGGTESDNAIIFNAVKTLRVERIISSPIEHHAVLDTIKYLEDEFDIETIWLKIDSKGNFSYQELESILSDGKKSLVSLMQVNNETGNITDIKKTGDICKKYGAYFHSDTVQGISHFRYNLKDLNIDFLCASAHKFGGPKGVGFLYKKENIPFSKMIHGGEQERNFRPGTENIIGINGLHKALEVVYNNFDKNELYLKELKQYIIENLKREIEGIEFNGESESLEKSVYNIINIKLPLKKPVRMLSFQFDLKGIAISEGSACSAGNNQGSHVLRELGTGSDRGSIRVSLSIYNTKQEADHLIRSIKEII